MKVPAMFLFIFAVLLTALPAAAAPMLLSIDMYGRNYSIDGVSGGGEEWLNMTFNAFYDSDDVITTYLDEYGTYEQTVTVHDWEFFWLDEQVAEGMRRVYGIRRAPRRTPICQSTPRISIYGLRCNRWVS